MNDPQQPGNASTGDKKSLPSALLQPALLLLASKPATRNGVPLLTTGGDATPVTPELVNQLREELP
jgi:hypothetical protein